MAKISEKRMFPVNKLLISFMKKKIKKKKRIKKKMKLPRKLPWLALLLANLTDFAKTFRLTCTAFIKPFKIRTEKSMAGYFRVC